MSAMLPVIGLVAERRGPFPQSAQREVARRICVPSRRGEARRDERAGNQKAAWIESVQDARVTSERYASSMIRSLITRAVLVGPVSQHASDIHPLIPLKRSVHFWCVLGGGARVPEEDAWLLAAQISRPCIRAMCAPHGPVCQI